MGLRSPARRVRCAAGGRRAWWPWSSSWAWSLGVVTGAFGGRRCETPGSPRTLASGGADRLHARPRTSAASSARRSTERPAASPSASPSPAPLGRPARTRARRRPRARAATAPRWRDRSRGSRSRTRGGYSGAVSRLADRGGGVRHRATRPVHPGLDHEAAHRRRGARPARPRAPLRHLRGQPRGRASSSWSAAATRTSRRRPPRACPARASLGRLAGRPRGPSRPAAIRVSLRLRRLPVLRSRVEPDLAGRATATVSPSLGALGERGPDGVGGGVPGPRESRPRRRTRPGRSPRRCASRASTSAPASAARAPRVATRVAEVSLDDAGADRRARAA